MGLCIETSFNAEVRNRASTNVTSFEERGWRRSEARHGSERSFAYIVSVQCGGTRDTLEVTSTSDVWACLILQPIC